MTVPTPIVEWAPAKGPYETVDTYLNLTGAANTFAATPTEPNYSGSGGTYQIVVRVAATDYTPASTQDLMSVYNATSQRSWKLSILASGALQWTRSTDGTTDVTQASSVPSLSDTTAYWLGVEYVTSTGAVAFYRAADSQVMPTIWSGWTLISSHSMTSGIPFASSARLVIGADDAGSNRFIGRIYEARLYRIGLNASFFPDRDGYSGMSSFASQSTLETYTLTGAATLTGDWADISTDVQAGTVTTGRQYELDRFNSGSASITWVSESRLFDFDNSASTYFGQLQPMRQFRIRMRRNDQVWPIFRGYCIDWDQTTDSSDNVFFTTVRLADAFALLDATAAPSPYESAVLAKSPTAYFRLHDTNSIPARSGSGSGVWSSTPTLTTPLIANDGSSSWSAAGGIYGKVRPTVTSLDTCVEFWMSTTASSGVIIDANAFGIRVLFYLVAGRLRVLLADVGHVLPNHQCGQHRHRPEHLFRFPGQHVHHQRCHRHWDQCRRIRRRTWWHCDRDKHLVPRHEPGSYLSVRRGPRRAGDLLEQRRQQLHGRHHAVVRADDRRPGRCDPRRHRLARCIAGHRHRRLDHADRRHRE